MTCAATMTDAMASAALVSWPLPVTSQPSPSAPASSIEPGPNSDGMTAIIASRCKRMTFRSNEVRKRYLSVHRLLSQACSGDA